MEPILSVRNLNVEFRTAAAPIRAVNGVSFDVRAGETLAIVGESGSGKSVSVLSMLRLIPMPPGKIVAGEVFFEGKDLLGLESEDLRKVRGNKISMVFQDPMTSLNPVMTIGRQIAELLELHLKLTRQQSRVRSIELLELVGIPNAKQRIDNYPVQFSGGMRQRVMIAMALSCNPKLLIADEPTTALDVTIQMQIVDVIRNLKSHTDMSIVWITHDLGVVAGIADRVAVMYAGRIVEIAPVNNIFYKPKHPYTVGLLNSIPRIDRPRPDKLLAIDGLPPDLTKEPTGCSFYPRCSNRIERCLLNEPLLVEYEQDRSVACYVPVGDKAESIKQLRNKTG